MQDRFKFRAKSITDGKLVYGHLSTSIEKGDNGGVECYYQSTAIELYYITDSDDELHIVYPDSIGQSTGLRDKNGKLIFEGDIYHHGDKDIIYTVIFQDTSFKGKQNGCYGSYAGLSHWSDCIEIIGNIYENPELLG